MHLESPNRARDKIIFLLKTKGPLPSTELSKLLSITSIAVRQHLQSLEEEELVNHTLEKGKVGRPAHIWALTKKANDFFSDRHSELTVSLIDSVKTVFGNDGLRQVLDAWTDRQMKRLFAQITPNLETIEQRIKALVDVRREQGYMADWEAHGDGNFSMVENHCPISEAACACLSICDGEAKVFQLVLGKDVSVVRTEHIANGDRRCTYQISNSASGTD